MVVVVLKADHNCCHSLVVSIVGFDYNWDSNNQNMIVGEEEVLQNVMRVEYVLNEEVLDSSMGCPVFERDLTVDTIVVAVLVIEHQLGIPENPGIDSKGAEDNLPLVLTVVEADPPVHFLESHNCKENHSIVVHNSD